MITITMVILHHLHVLSNRFQNDDITNFLKIEEETWRQKSHAIWLTQGDNNMKFLHNYSDRQIIFNIIWELKDSHGNLTKS